MSRKNIEAELIINDLEFPNKGVALLNDEKVFVKNTIPEQKLKLNIKRKKHKLEGRVVELIEKAPYEIKPECEKFGLCGGCTYQNISYDKELEFKENTVLKLLKNLDYDKYEFLGIMHSPNLSEYRNKMEFSFGDTGIDGELALGMRKRESFYEVVDADKCLLVDSDVRQILILIRDYFKNSTETFYHKTKKTGSLRHLLVRKAFFTGQIMVGLVTTSELNTNLNPLKDLLVSQTYSGELVCFAHIVNNSVADVVKADSVDILFGQDFFIEKLLGLEFKISIFSFFQTNSAGAEVLYSVIKDFAGNVNNKTVFDLYCGTGTIAQIVSSVAKKVIGVEIVEEAVEAAKVNADLNNLQNCYFIAGDVLKVIDEFSEKPDLIILDPPREGINPKAIGKIVDFGADRIVYVSCKASSMIRDLQYFVENGYEISKIKCVDMFPRTYHVETCVLLSHKNS